MATPNLYEDNKGKVTKETGSSGGIREYELISFDGSYIIKDATMDDIGTLFLLVFPDDEYENVKYHALYIRSVSGSDADVTFYSVEIEEPVAPPHLIAIGQTAMGILVTTTPPSPPQ